jgi:hypothetical protein
MVLITIFLSLFLSFSHAADSALSAAFKAKDYSKISNLYQANMSKNYSRQELILISYSLRKLGFFRQDIKLNIQLVKKHYVSQHQKLLTSIKRGDTIDGDKYPEALKVLYWNLFTSYGEIIKGYNADSTLVEDDNKYFNLFSKILSELEFREGKVDKYNDAITAHRQYLTNKIYRFKSSWSVQYVSWQQDATLKNTTTGDAGLIITNRGYCAGGDVGVENYKFHFYIDGCVLYGSGGVKNNDQDLIENYQQANVPAYGIKIGPGASIIVSSSKSRIGIRLPMLYSIQKLTTPTDPAYSVEQGPSTAFISSLYSRWQFNKWYFQTEFGKYIQQEQTFWGLGIGKEF